VDVAVKTVHVKKEPALVPARVKIAHVNVIVVRKNNYLSRVLPYFALKESKAGFLNERI